MAKYTVPLTSWANIAVDVETDETDPKVIARLAEESAYTSLCNHCSDLQNNSLEIGDEWTASEYDGNPIVTKIED